MRETRTYGSVGVLGDAPHHPGPPSHRSRSSRFPRVKRHLEPRSTGNRAGGWANGGLVAWEGAKFADGRGVAAGEGDEVGRIGR